MSEAATLTMIFGFAFAVVAALVGVVWAMLQGRLSTAEKQVEALQTQNTAQEAAIAGLVQRMIAREEAHSQHREDTSGRLARIEDKLDRLLSGRSYSPSPGRYPPTGDKPHGER